MLPRADIISVNPVGRAEALRPLEGVGDARQQAFQRSLAALLGQSLQGEILSKLTDGTFIVRVAGNAARMQLPEGSKVGAQVPLTLVAVEPRPTFQLAEPIPARVAQPPAEAEQAVPGTPAGTPTRAAPLTIFETAAPPAEHATAQQSAIARPLAQAAALLAKAPLTAAEHLPALDAGSTPATLSDGARLIASVLSATQGKDAPAPLIHARAPLVDSPAAPPAHVAAAMKQAIAHSGLFYESHVAEWADGKRPLAELMHEPQMQQAAARTAAGIDGSTTELLGQQLLTHEQAKVVWQGQLWPGQPMQWEISKDGPDRGRGEAGEQDALWRSSVRFRFERLGDVTARVVLHGGQLHIQVETADGAVGALLRGHSDALAGALAAAGTPLASLDIQAGGGDA